MKKGLSIACLFVLILLGANRLQAQEKHKVKDGETLFSIGQRYDVKVERLRTRNQLGDEPIEPGQTLQIPVSGEKTAPDTVKHKVTEGETLYSICQQYNAHIDTVLRINPDARKEIEIGQTLQIPVGSDPPDGGGNERFPFDSSKSGYYYHPVKKGQTLFRISQQYGVKIDTIRAVNSHLEREPEVGQLLRIPKSKGKKPKKEDPLALPKDLSRKGYRIYSVEKGETLYSIARRNGLTQSRMKRENPQLQGELKKGQDLRIPQREGNPRTPRSHQDTLIIHTVNEGESVRSIATMYGTDPTLIVLANELFFRDIRKDDILLIPIPPRTPEKLPVGSKLKDRYRITLLLPLYLQKNDSIMKDLPGDKAPELYGPSSYALEFYQGFRIAADSVANERGISFDLRTIPTKKKDDKLVEKLKAHKVRQSDLVVGPLYNSNLKKTAKYLKGSEVHQVCPVRHSNDILLGRPNISKAIPSSSSLIKELAEHLVKAHGHHNVLLLDSGKRQDDRRVKILRERFNRLLPNIDNPYRDSLRTVSVSGNNIDRLKKAIDPDTLNVLLTPSKKKVFASRLMNKLSKLNSQLGKKNDYSFAIYASESWKDFETIDIKYKQRFNLHIITSRHIEHDSLASERYYRKYRQRNNTDPGSYAFLGHDVASFYLNALGRFGTGFQERFERVDTSPLHLGFDLFRTGVSSGFENRHSYIIHYTDDHHVERRPTR